MNKLLSILVIGILLFSGFGASALTKERSDEVKLIESITFSEPYIQEYNQYANVTVKEATSYMKESGNPVLPVYVKVFTFPIGTKIMEVNCTFSNIQEKILSKKIAPAQEPMSVTPSTEKTMVTYQVKNEEVYSSKNSYPTSRFKYHLGAGLANNDHVMFLTIHYYPVLYFPMNNFIEYTTNATIEIIYEKGQNPLSFQYEYDLAIIAPSEFSDDLQPLVNHKNGIGLATIFKSTEDIYSNYQGRDEAEQIKYFVKDAVESWGISYVMLVGSVYKLPMRMSNVSIWGNWEHETLTDLYYSDIYDADGHFCSWDSNNNDRFGETGADQVDLYPDVYIGRLACDSIEEVQIVVDKIIHYEIETFGQDWFNDMIFIGGNTFPQWHSPGNEGEEHNKHIMEIMTDFEPSAVIWTSKRNFNRRTISNAISEGAGFLDYSGHGFEHGMGTYKPHGRMMKSYLTPYIKDLTNGYKLPIIFFDACLTAKLDFTLDDILRYKGYQMFKILTLLPGIDKDMRLPSYAWCFVKHDGGGAIATIGATRTAFGGEDFGCEKLSTEFFSSYNRGGKLGEMMTNAQNAYIHDLPDDEFTVEEFTLLDDPSLHIGGYVDDKEPPEIEIINPKEGYLHLSGIPIMPTPSDAIATTMAPGGFRFRPIQILAEDDFDEKQDIQVKIYIDVELKGLGILNSRNGYHEWKWTGWGLGTHTLKVTAEDKSGNVGSSETEIWYLCFIP